MGGNDIQLTNPVGTYSGGLVGGYQHYFGESKRNGIKVSAHLYAGYSSFGTADLSSTAKSTGGSSTSSDIGDSYYLPISFGADVKYIFDILQMGKHTLGVSAGVGYEMSMYLHMNTSSPAIASSVTKGSTTTTSSSYDNSGRVSDADFSTQGFYPVIGIHYYYGHNQFEILYRFGGALAQTGSKELKILGATAAELHMNSNDYLALNYTYRF